MKYRIIIFLTALNGYTMAQQNFKWLDTLEYPFQSHYFQINGSKMHYIDEGEGPVLLFVHGTPSWSFDFRKQIKELSKQYRCIAIDHIGFGLSDKPRDFDYSTQAHSKRLEQFILDKKLENICLLVHDFGGPIALHVALKYPQKFSKIIMLNTWMWSSADDPDFIKFSKILKSPLLPFLYKRLNFSPRFVLPKSFGDKKLKPSLKKQYTKPFANTNERNGALAFARSLLNDQEWFEQIWQQKEVFYNTPILVIWGMKDPVIKAHNLEKLMGAFPHAQLVKLESCGHFPQEEEAEKCTLAIQRFLGMKL
jgi:pimeloyl-ACP methyl ester carboxylesterase